MVHHHPLEIRTYRSRAQRAAQVGKTDHAGREGRRLMTEHIRVVLVDDHRVVRQGLRTYLESFSDLQVVGEASSGEEALRHLVSWLPDVVVMDLLMPGGMDGVEAIRRVCSLLPQTHVIALTSYSDDAR